MSKATQRSLLFTTASDRPPAEEEEIHVTKRDGRRERMDKNKVSECCQPMHVHFDTVCTMCSE
jgi:hypothetical protein